MENKILIYVTKNFFVCCSNPVVPCSLIPAPSLEPWREQPDGQHHAAPPQEGTESFVFPFYKK